MLFCFSYNSFSQRQTDSINHDIQSIYNKNKKYPGKAVLLSALLPSLGHAYAGNWTKGLLFATARLGSGFIAFRYGIESDPQNWFHINGWFFVGLVSALAFCAWEFIDVVSEVDKSNTQLLESLKSGHNISLGLEPANYGIRIQFVYSF